jgi:hypothetical protein
LSMIFSFLGQESRNLLFQHHFFLNACKFYSSFSSLEGSCRSFLILGPCLANSINETADNKEQVKVWNLLKQTRRKETELLSNMRGPIEGCQ